MGGRHSKYWLPWLVGKFENKNKRLTINGLYVYFLTNGIYVIDNIEI